jgi:hypothetical protein
MPEQNGTMTWLRTGPREHAVTIERQGEANRIYRNGVLVGTFPPVRSPALTLVSCSFHDCGGVRP